ncbi:hypothetical protein, partial [Streptomyces sp. NPDC019937]|uniref:hypothetical protein n=1 Tax=Streptomyces sp. NPDC019937 TaxID=3154787 RepID=UPI0033EDE04D
DRMADPLGESLGQAGKVLVELRDLQDDGGMIHKTPPERGADRFDPVHGYCRMPLARGRLHIPALLGVLTTLSTLPGKLILTRRTT